MVCLARSSMSSHLSSAARIRKQPARFCQICVVLDLATVYLDLGHTHYHLCKSKLWDILEGRRQCSAEAAGCLAGYTHCYWRFMQDLCLLTADAMFLVTCDLSAQIQEHFYLRVSCGKRHFKVTLVRRSLPAERQFIYNRYAYCT
jgi:hypothetical protein